MRYKNNSAFSAKHILAMTSAVVVLAYGAAFAQSSHDHIVNLSGSSPEFCSIPVATEPHEAEFSELTNANGKIISTTIPVPIGNLSCNYGIKLGLQTTNGALTRIIPAGNVPENFADKVQYTATVDWSGSIFALETDGTPSKKANTTLGPQDDLLSINISTHASDKMLISGQYSDVLTLRLGGII